MEKKVNSKLLQFIVNLGPKGAKPPKPQRNPRQLKSQGLPRLIIDFFKGDKEEVNDLLKLYESSDDATQESILTFLIRHKKVPTRLMKSVFKIGTHRYNRIRNGESRKKPGGDKPSFVSIVLFY